MQRSAGNRAVTTLIGRRRRLARQPDEAKVRERAYQIWMQKGGRPTSTHEEETNYFEALRQIEIEERAYFLSFQPGAGDPVANYYAAERAIAAQQVAANGAPAAPGALPIAAGAAPPAAAALAAPVVVPGQGPGPAVVGPGPGGAAPGAAVGPIAPAGVLPAPVAPVPVGAVGPGPAAVVVPAPVAPAAVGAVGPGPAAAVAPAPAPPVPPAGLGPQLAGDANLLAAVTPPLQALFQQTYQNLFAHLPLGAGVGQRGHVQAQLVLASDANSRAQTLLTQLPGLLAAPVVAPSPNPVLGPAVLANVINLIQVHAGPVLAPQLGQRLEDRLRELRTMAEGLAAARGGNPGGGPAGVTLNFARADINVAGIVPATRYAVSGQNNRGLTAVPAQTHFNAVTQRPHDSEYKIFENVAQQLDPAGAHSPVVPNLAPNGSVRMYSERPMCVHCQAVMAAFRATFPNVQVQVLGN